MEALQIFVAIFILALASSLTFASDPSPLQDFCVAINDPKGSGMSSLQILSFFLSYLCLCLMNIQTCTGYESYDLSHSYLSHPFIRHLYSSFSNINSSFFLLLLCLLTENSAKMQSLAKQMTSNFSGLHIRKNTSNTFGSTVTPVNVAQMPGLHTLGISMVRIDYAPNGGLNPPHTHPRASEVLVVLEGTLHVGFVTSNPDNRLISKVLYPGEVFVFPVGLIHFQYNIGNTYAVAFAGLSSENPGVITIANAVFGSNPSINADILAKAFNLDRKMVKNLQSKF
ncbi:hypothetical protein CXB51_036158 [Gossypium anomalum]|uniref:Germin-like protein n=1 Tax=Gossypium anomalum TaxID=47600 RepID=A0A8J5Y7R9_9ROSI|nr:hypothetical protein CXB51_036158 [Gossypium anomalum]